MINVTASNVPGPPGHRLRTARVLQVSSHEQARADSLRGSRVFRPVRTPLPLVPVFLPNDVFCLDVKPLSVDFAAPATSYQLHSAASSVNSIGAGLFFFTSPGQRVSMYMREICRRNAGPVWRAARNIAVYLMLTKDIGVGYTDSQSEHRFFFLFCKQT